MKNNIGVLSRPSMRNTKKPVFLTGLMTMLLIVTFIFTLKIYEPTKHTLITGGILVYPFTFLITAYLSKYYGFEEAKKNVFTSAILFGIFFLLIMVCLIPSPNNSTENYNAIIQYVFAAEHFTIGSMDIFYPTMGQFCGILIAFIATHLLYAAIYKAIHNYTNDYLAVGLALLISAIVDRVIFVPILLLENLLDGSNTLEFLIKCLTSEFIVTILFVMIIIIIYVIITKFKDKKKVAQN